MSEVRKYHCGDCDAKFRRDVPICPECRMTAKVAIDEPVIRTPKQTIIGVICGNRIEYDKFMAHENRDDGAKYVCVTSLDDTRGIKFTGAMTVGTFYELPDLKAINHQILQSI